MKNTKNFEAFVLIPFSTDFDDVYEKLIKKTFTELGFEVTRADDVNSYQNILKDIISKIQRSDLIIADLSNKNPNVFYELGIAHTMGKPTIMLSQSVNDVPFDLKSYRIINYSSHFSEASKLIDELKKAGKNFKDGVLDFGNPVSDFITVERKKDYQEESRKSNAESEIQPEMKEKSIKKGFFDIVPATYSSLGNLSEIANKIGTARSLYKSSLAARTSELKKEKEEHKPTNVLALNASKIVTNTAKDLSEYAKKLEELHPEFHCEWELFNENIIGYVNLMKSNPKYRRDIVKMYSSLKSHKQTFSGIAVLMKTENSFP